MGFEPDEEILQDFLVEAGELLEQLSEQLVELEQNPEDRDLLNAIFRGFHTVKGGAGFLQLDALVGVCHIAENVFDRLRNGQISITSELMDVVLQTLDAVNVMFDQVKSREDPTPATPELLLALKRLANGESLAVAEAEDPPAAEPEEIEQEETVAEVATPAAPQPAEGDITDDEFESLLDALGDEGSSADTAKGPADAITMPTGIAPKQASPNEVSLNDEISEDEFEALLDQLHGSGKFNADAGKPAVAAKPLVADKPVLPAKAPAPAAGPGPAKSAGKEKAATAGGDEITDDEFEALLDELHGKGKFAAPEDAAAAAAKAPKAPPPPKAPVTPIAPVAKAPAAGTPPANAAASGGDELISDSEFESLLDELHGKGKGPAIAGKTASATGSPRSVPAAKPAVADKAPAATQASAASKPATGAAPVAKAAAKPAAVPRSTQAADTEDVAVKEAPAKEAASKDSSQNIATETTVRVDTKRLDDIMNMVGELVLVRNRLKRLGEEIADEAMTKAVSNLDVVTSDLQSAVMQTRMQPIKKVFGRFPRVVRDLARTLKKEVNLILKGEETDLDKNLVEALSDPLVHLVRNAVDHGVELPEVREAAGKPRMGRVVLAAEQEGDHILLSIDDDGGGMDPKVLRQKGVEKGLFDQDAADRLTDTEAFNLIFAPGFSTKAVISDVSGRGVGMDVVKTKISQLNGTLAIDSELGRGTRIIIKVPLTLAIMPTLMVMLADQAFAFPLVSVVEIFHLDLTTTNIVDGQECIVVRDNVFPLFHVKRWLVKGHLGEPSSDSGHVVIVSVGTKRVGLVVDQLVGQEEVVIKPLGRMLHGTPGMAGATITGDGRIALILDIPSLLGRYAKSSKVVGRKRLKKKKVPVVTDTGESGKAASA